MRIADLAFPREWRWLCPCGALAHELYGLCRQCRARMHVRRRTQRTGLACRIGVRVARKAFLIIRDAVPPLAASGSRAASASSPALPAHDSAGGDEQC
jgi:hypothetical protein